MEISDSAGTAGWVIAAIGFLGTLSKYIFDYWKKRSEDNKEVKIHDSTELNEKYSELHQGFKELEIKFDVAVTHLNSAVQAFKLILPIVMDAVKDDPVKKLTVTTAAKLILKTEEDHEPLT